MPDLEKSVGTTATGRRQLPCCALMCTAQEEQHAKCQQRESLELLAEAAGSRADSTVTYSSSTGHLLLLVPWSACQRTAWGIQCITCAATRIWSNDHIATTTQQFAVSLPPAPSLSLPLLTLFTDEGRTWSGQINSWNFLLKSLSPCPWSSKPSTS